MIIYKKNNGKSWEWRVYLATLTWPWMCSPLHKFAYHSFDHDFRAFVCCVSTNIIRLLFFSLFCHHCTLSLAHSRENMHFILLSRFTPPQIRAALFPPNCLNPLPQKGAGLPDDIMTQWCSTTVCMRTDLARCSKLTKNGRIVFTEIVILTAFFIIIINDNKCQKGHVWYHE